MNDNSGLFDKYRITIILVFLVVLGTLLVGVFEPTGKLPSKFLEHLGMAIAVAGCIGVVIELTLQREITRNVFRAAIGYLLPDELRAELRWIYSLPFLCE